MATLNQLSLDFNKSILLNDLAKPDRSSTIWDYTGGFNVIDYLVTRKAPARRIVGNNGVFEKPIMGKGHVVAQVASTSIVNGNQLKVNFVDTTYDKFRVTEVVHDGTANDTQGRVVATAPGYIILEVAPPVVAWNTSLHFLAGSFATRIYNAQAIRGSHGLASLYEVPTWVKNQTSVVRDTLQLDRKDFSSTWVHSTSNGFFALQQESILMRRFAGYLEQKAMYGYYGTQTSSLDGQVNYSMGFKAAVKDPQRGGIYQAWTNIPTESQFISFISAIADRQNSPHVELTLVVGRGALKTIQGYNTSMITNTGIRNTVGGEKVEGLNSFLYSIAGIKVNLIHNAAWDDPDLFPQQSTILGANGVPRTQFNMLVLDMGKYESLNGGGMLPSCEKVYCGEEEIMYRYSPGIIDVKGIGAEFGYKGGMLSVSDTPTITLSLFSDCAYDFMSYRMGFAELAY
jgi:hypothetical protein